MATKEPEVLDGTKIVPTVELQLTKSDLVDMVMAEQEESVEAELERIDTQIEAIKEQKQQVGEEHRDALSKMLKERHGKRIKAAERFFGSKVKLNTDVSSKRYRDPLSKCNTFSFEVYNSKRRKTRKDVSLPTLSLIDKAYAVVYGDGKKSSCYHSDGTEDGHWSVGLKLTQEELDKMPTVKKLLDLNKQHVELVKSRCLGEAAMANIETMGSRAKARMVRKVLEGSKQGRELLKSIPKLDSSRLLPPAKKTK